jgi:hypothetical protein
VKRVDATSTRVSLWFAFFAGPLAWTAHELLSYALVKLACANGLGVLEHLLTVAALALAAAGAYAALRARGEGQPQGTSEFVAGAAILISAVFAFAIFMEAIPDLLVNPCL